MDFFQVLPWPQFYVDVGIQLDIAPISNPNSNLSQPSSSSSSSHQFFVEFILHDPNYLFYYDLGELIGFPSEQLKKSPTIMYLPNASSTSIWMTLTLNNLGLEPMFHYQVIQALRTRVHTLIHGNESQSPAFITLHVSIKRIKTDTGPLIGPEPFEWDAVGSNDVAIAAPMANGVDDEYNFEKQAIRTLKRVKANDKKMYMEEGCAICLEELQVDDDDKKKSDDKTPMKLPCKHAFHNRCILLSFKESLLCPLCRSNVLDRIDFSF